MVEAVQFLNTPYGEKELRFSRTPDWLQRAARLGYIKGEILGEDYYYVAVWNDGDELAGWAGPEDFLVYDDDPGVITIVYAEHYEAIKREVE